MMPQIGDTFKHPYQTKPSLVHVRGIVDDLIVCRWWLPSRQRWVYETFDPNEPPIKAALEVKNA